MEHKEYNGWHNYETWTVKLWLDNDEGTYNYMRELSAEVLADHTDEDGAVDANGSRSEFAGWLKDYHDEQLEELNIPASVFRDLMNAALSEVNWHQIAGAYLEEATEAAS
jgi:hypothetical protein